MLFSVFTTVKAQDDCALKYNMLKIDIKTKSYDSALDNLEYSLNNCSSLTVNTYKYGGGLINTLLKKATSEEKPRIIATGIKLYKMRFELYPDVDAAKAHSDYADFLKKIGGDKKEIYEHYEIAFKTDPAKLGVGSIIYFFNEVVEKHKDNDLQIVFNRFDVIIEAINIKVGAYLRTVDELQAKQEKGEELLSSEKRKLDVSRKNSKALGQVEGILDNKIEEISTCEYLIPSYEEEYISHKTDVIWLRRAINRMFKKDCTEAPLYAKFVEQYQDINPSPEASVLYAGILMGKGEVNKAIVFFEKAILQETNPKKKANNLYKVATIFKKRNQNVRAVSYAKKAIAIRPSLGRAYTLIATSYAGAANSCGTTEFEKRMVYVAAENYAKKAGRVDPSIGVYAGKLAKSYKANQPSKKVIFNNKLGLKSGDNYTIGSWINETVRVP